MESQRPKSAEVAKCKEENSIISGLIKGVFGPESVDNHPQELISTKPEHGTKMYGITTGKDRKIKSANTDMELHIQRCHKRIIEFDQELKQRDNVVLLLGDTLSGIVKTLKSVNLLGQSSNEDLTALMTRVHGASELLSHMGREEVGLVDITPQEQVRSFTNKMESEVTQDVTCGSANNDSSYRPIEMGVEQCGQHCAHTEKIAHIIKTLRKGFDMLQITTDVSQQSVDVDIANKIDYLVTLAMQYKKDSAAVVANLDLFKKENQSIQSLLLDKQTEVNSMTCHIKNLEIELKELKSKLSNLDDKQEENSWQLDMLKDVKTDKATISTRDKDIQSVNSMEIMDGNDKSPMEKKIKDIGVRANPTKTGLPEKLAYNVSLTVHDFSSDLGTLEIRSDIADFEKVESEPNSDRFNGPESQPGSSGVPEKSPCVTEESFYEEHGKGPEERLVHSENIEEFLLNLSSKAKELIMIKKQLELVVEKERKLQSQLNSAMDKCDKAEERCRKAENLAMNLQNDFESMHCKLREIELNKTNLDVENSGQVASALIVSPSTPVCVSNWLTCSSMDLVEGLRDVGEEYLSSFLTNFWKKVKLVLDIVNIPEDKTDVFVSKKQANLKSSIESDLNELALYLTRKCNLLRQLKLSIEAESRFHNLQVQVEKEVLNQVNIRSIFNKESVLNTEERNIFTNGRTRSDGSDDIVDSLKSLNFEMDCINSKVIKCLKYVMEEDFEKQSTELKMNFAGDMASMSHLQALQLNSLKEECNEKIAKIQEKTEEILANYKICSEVDEIKESHKIDLESVWNNLDENQREVYDVMKERFERITAEQISIATSLYKENYDLKIKQEICLLKSIHKQEIEEIKSTLEQQRLRELFSIRQEMSKSHKENVNEVIQAVDVEMKELRCKCQDLALKTSLGNAATLDELKKYIISECQSALKEMSGVWLKEFENDMAQLELRTRRKRSNAQAEDSADMNAVDPHFHRSLGELREILLTKSEVHFKTVAHWQLLRMKELVEKLQMEHKDFKDKLREIHPEERVDVPALGKNDNKLLENKSECCSVNQNICSLMSAGDGPWINEMHNLRKELEAKHAKEMESLRLYFEKKYAEVEKRYSEEVLTQRSKKCSHTGSSNSSSRTSLSGSDPELESDQFFLSQEEVDTSRNIEEYERISLDMQLVGRDISAQVKNFVEHNASGMPSSVTDNIELEAKIREELQLQFEEEHQRRLAVIIKDLETQHEEDLKTQIAAEAKAYSDHIEEVTNAIKKCSEEEQEKFIRSHREMMDDFLMQHQKDVIALNELHDQELNALRNSGIEVEELKAEINKMKNRHNQELVIAKMTMKSEIDEASQKLIQEHAIELTELKQNLKRNHKEEVDRLKNEIKRKEAYCEEMKRLGEAELEEIKENFEERLQDGIEQAKQSIVKSLEEQIQALLAKDEKEKDKESGNMIELVKLKEQLGLKTQNDSVIKECQTKEASKEQKDVATKVVADNSEWSNPVLLEQRVDKLKQGIESDFNNRFSKSECMGRDLLTLKLQVNQLEQSKNVLLSRLGEADIEMDDATSVTILHTDLDKLLKDRDKWKKVSQTLKTVLMDVLEYTHNCEEELNGTIVQSILRLSGASDKYNLSEDNVQDEDQPRRVHFAPDVVTNIFEQEELEVEGGGENVITRLEESSEETRVELKQCLGRLRAEASALLGLSTSIKQKDENIAFDTNLIHSQQEFIDKITLLENHLREETMEKDRLKVELHTTKGLFEGHSASEAALLARATQAEAQLATLLTKRADTQRVETVAEGFGESSESPNFNRQFQKLAQLREKARWMLKECHGQGENNSAEGENQSALFGPLVAHLIEELCSEGDRLSEEARREREDLQLQVEAADKQLRSTRAFLEEQAIEREQEREEFQKELNRLNEALGGRERDKGERERMVGEEIPLTSEREGRGTLPPSSLTVEALEQQLRELTQMLKETTEKKEESETELKAAIDKIWDLREIIRELEGQVEGSLLLEKDLQRKNETLTMEMTLQSKKLDDLIEELELLQNSLGYSMPGEKESESHTALLEKALRKHCLQVEEAKAMGPALKDLKKQLLDIGASIDRKTKELETLQVTPMTSGNCNSPSEDVSIREQLEQATWRSESPMEDEVAEREVPDDIDVGMEGRVSTPLQLPKVPLAELHYLREKFIRHSQAQEPLLKRIHDLEMQIQSLRHNEEELMTEREVLQSQVEEQLLQASELQARLDEARRRGGRHNLCMTVTPLPSSPLSHSPIGSPSSTPDHPSFCCAGLTDARHEIEKLTECLEKKELEVTQLKSALENSKKVVASQENELTNKAREEAETLKKMKEFEKLQSEKDMLQVKLSHKIKNDGTFSFSILLDALLAEKNEEIDFLGLQLENLKDQLSKVLSGEEGKAMQYGPSLEQNVKNQVAEIPEKNKSNNSLYDEVEVLRECAASEPSLGRADVIHVEEFEGYHKVWFHSTKIDAQNSPSDSPGLGVSPLTPYDKKHIMNSEPIFEEDSLEKAKNSPSNSAGVGVSRRTHYDKKHVVISEPPLKEESLEKTPSHNFSGISDSSREKNDLSSKDLHDSQEQEGKSNVFKDVEIQTDEDVNVEDLKMAICDKGEEIKTLKNKVDALKGEKDSLSLLIAELREKIDWHSRHLEKYEEESLGRDALINEVQTEKKYLEVALQKSGQELATLQTTHAVQQDSLLNQEALIKTLNGKVEKYSKANKDQHMLLKAAQQERKEIITMLSNISLGSNQNLQDDQGLLSPNLTENKSVSEGIPEESSRQKLPNVTGPKISMKEMVSQLVNEVKSLRIKLNNLIIQRSRLKEDLEKAAEFHSMSSLKGQATENAGECGRHKNEDGNQSNDKLGPISLQTERGSSPSLFSLEQMMEKVQKEGREVLSLSELAAGKRSTPGSTPIFVTSPLGSPKSVDNASNITDRCNSSVGSLKSKADSCAEDERMKLIMRVQALENELSSKEREEMRKRDWMEFQEKEGYAGWTGVVEAVGQKHRHELNVLEQLGEQRNARARLEAEYLQLHQQFTQAEADVRKVTYRLGMERSHVIRLESALQQEKSNFSQLQVSLDTERRRANMTKQLNSKVNKTLQSELVQYQAKVSYLQKSLKQECDVRMELEARVKPMQLNQSYTTEASEEQRLQLEAIANEESLQLKKIEKDCERKALEQELEDEKEKRFECQQEIIQLRNLLEARQNHETYGPVDSVRWSNATSPSTPYVGESSFNAEDMLQNLKGINQVLGWHIRQREDYNAPDLASIETEKHYLEAKCCHLEQKVIALQDVLTRERALWTNERSLLLKEQQYLLEMNADVPQNCTPKELKKFQDLVQQLYSLYWRSERNRKALAWQKRYFLSVLGDYRHFKVDTITELSKVTDEQRIVVDKIAGSRVINNSKGYGASSQLQHSRDRVRKSFRVLVWTVIATLKMKVLVLRSMTGIRVGCQSLLEDILQPGSLYPKTPHSPYHHQSPQHIPSAVGTSEMPFHYGIPSLSSTSNCRKSYSVGDMKCQRFP